jgi:hypothetical protein
MQAVISGRAGVALLFEGDWAASLRVGAGESAEPCELEDFPFLFGDAKDLAFVEDAGLPQIAERLGLEHSKQQALQLVLISLDKGLSMRTRRAAGEELESLLAQVEARNYVERVLFAHLLPPTADLTGALVTLPGNASRAKDFLRVLETCQQDIAAVQYAWEEIPKSLFGGSYKQRQARVVAVREGLFRDLVKRFKERESLATFVAVSLENKAVLDLPNAQVFLDKWVALLQLEEKYQYPVDIALPKAYVAEVPTIYAGSTWISNREAPAASSEIFYFNGINGETGDYALPPATLQEIAVLARQAWLDEGERDDVQALCSKGRRLRCGEAKDLAQAGWGVIFAQNDERVPAIYAALAELLGWRRAQAGRFHEHYYREYLGEEGYRPGDTKESFLARFGVGPGSVDPDDMPYYLMIVGDPATIPYSFQYQLEVAYAVGRLSFATIEEYARYAHNVVQMEAAPAVDRQRRAVFFGPRHPGDPATALSADQLVAPLAVFADGRLPGWETWIVPPEKATKARLGSLLGGGETPDLLFTAGHGLVLANGSPQQLERQGALVCQDWPGAQVWRGPLAPEHYFAAEDLPADPKLNGLIAFHFSCYSAGSPAVADFQPPQAEPKALAPHPFVSRLPQRLLGAGALAVIGHVERAWECSMWPNPGRHRVFEDVVERLLTDHPVGLAMECFRDLYAEVSTDLATSLQADRPVDEAVLVARWTAGNDARNYAVLGDPAVRLPVGTGMP